MKKIKWLCLALCVALVALILPHSAFAATCSGVETSIIECEGGGDAGIWAILGLAIDIMTMLIGILAVIGIAVFGIQYLTAGGDVAKVTKAKRRMYEIVIGLVAYVLIWTGAQWLLPGGLFKRPDDVTNLTLSFPKETTYVGDSTNVIASFEPIDASDKTYSLSSSNTKIAKTTNNTVRCLNVGEASITATTVNSVESTATIKCVEKPKADSGGGGTNPSDLSSTPASSSAVGLAGSFGGKTAVVNIYLDEQGCYLRNSNWSSGKKATVDNRINNALSWLKRQMSGVSGFDLVYSTDTNSDLAKSVQKTSGSCIGDGGLSAAASLIPTVIDVLQSSYPMTDAECGSSNCTSVEGIKKKYGVDNVAFMVHLATSSFETGGYTELFDPRASDADVNALRNSSPGYEYSLIFDDAALGVSTSLDEYQTAVIAHELLHQFGAPDLYCQGWGAGYSGSPQLVPSGYYSCPVGFSRTGAEATEGDLMGSGYLYVPLSQIKLSDITKYYTGVISDSPNNTGYSGYGTWGASQH